MTETSRTSYIGLRVPTAMKDRLEKMAEADHRTLTSLIIKVLSDEMATKKVAAVA